MALLFTKLSLYSKLVMKILNNLFIKRYGFLLATVVTVAINGLATFAQIGGLSVKEVSDKFFTILTPASYTFSIWSVIYTSLFIIGVLIATGNVKISSKGLALYILGSLTNCAWIFLWQFLQPAPSMVLLFLLVVCNTLVYFDLKKANEGALRLGITSAYMIYLGWSIVASVINLTVFLKYFIGFNGEFLDVGIWAVIVLYAALAINVIIAIKEQNPTTALVLLWATAGIANTQDNKILLGGVGSMYTVLVLISVQAIREYYLHRKIKIQVHKEL